MPLPVATSWDEEMMGMEMAGVETAVQVRKVHIWRRWNATGSWDPIDGG